MDVGAPTVDVTLPFQSEACDEERVVIPAQSGNPENRRG